MRALPPQQRGYQRLREELARYRALAKEGGWPQLSSGSILREGMRSSRVAVLRKRLIAEGDMQDTPAEDARLFDPAVKFAVDRFQVRHRF